MWLVQERDEMHFIEQQVNDWLTENNFSASDEVLQSIVKMVATCVIAGQMDSQVRLEAERICGIDR